MAPVTAANGVLPADKIAPMPARSLPLGGEVRYSVAVAPPESAGVVVKVPVPIFAAAGQLSAVSCAGVHVAGTAAGAMNIPAGSANVMFWRLSAAGRPV
jgi:hypothetical protein